MLQWDDTIVRSSLRSATQVKAVDGISRVAEAEPLQIKMIEMKLVR